MQSVYKIRSNITFSLLLLILTIPLARAADLGTLSPGTGPKHAIAMHGEPLYGPDFENFNYIDPYAEQGGELRLGIVGSFDSLNPFIVQGATPIVPLDGAYPVVQLHSLEGLMVRGHDEPFTLYGLIAETVEIPEDRSWVEFTLNPKARFSDGSKITVEDVVFSWKTLRDQGLPNVRRYYSMVEEALVPAPDKVRFVFSEQGNKELPLIIGLMTVFSKSYWQGRDFSKSTLTPILGSGPYTVDEVEPGRRLVFRRNRDYWGDDLAVNQGLNNFDIIRYDFFRDDTSMFEAFKSSELSARLERNAKTWATGYNLNTVKTGQILLTELAHQRTANMYSLVFNTRRAIFSDVRVRDAFILLFDFDWMNQNFFYSAYSRLQSYFDNSELSSRDRPASELERELLDDFEDDVRPNIMELGWRAPVGGSVQATRTNKRLALNLLSEAGWVVQDGRMVSAETGEPLRFEIMIGKTQEEKLALTYAKALQDVGIEAKVSIVEPIQFQLRLETYDFDMVPFTWRGTLSPGNEQAFRFGSAEADIEGTFNLAGVKSPAVDFLIDQITNATTREDLVAATRALDRVLLSGSYAIPLYFAAKDRVAHWSEIQIPEQQALTGMKIQTWWSLPDN